MNPMDREAILKTAKPEYHPKLEINIPEWGGKFFIKMLGGDERDEYDELVASMRDDEGELKSMAGLKADLTVKVLYNEKGEQVFKPEDAEEVNKLPSVTIEKIFNKATRFCHLDEKSVEEDIKNLEGSQKEKSGCKSQSDLESPQSKKSKEKSTLESSPGGKLIST